MFTKKSLPKEPTKPVLTGDFWPDLPEGHGQQKELGKLDFNDASLFKQTGPIFSIPQEVMKEIILYLYAPIYFELIHTPPYRVLTLMATCKQCYHMVRPFVKYKNPHRLVSSLFGISY